LTPRRLSSVSSAALVLVVMGCGASIPDSSDVHRARAASNAQDPQPNSYIPDDPAPGAHPREVVDGFLDAMNAYPRTLSLARKFLTPDAAAAWKPSEAVSVYRSRHTTRPVTRSPDRMVTMVATHLGSLDVRGSWQTREFEYNHTFSLVLVNGQWRIANPPKDLLVDSEYFSRYYGPASLYFFASSRKILVPDPVFMLQGSGMAAALVRALVRGPSEDLKGVVSSALEESAAVGVSVRDGVVTVSLPASARSWSRSDPELIAVQIVWTLRQIQEISGVRILAGGRTLSIPDTQSVIRTSNAYLAYGPVGLTNGQNLDGIVSGHVVSIGTSSPGRVAGPIGQLDKRVDGVAVTVASGQLAAVVDGGTRLVVGGTSRDSSDLGTWVRGHDLRSPSWDRTGFVWIVDNPAGGSRILVATSTEVRAVAAPGLSGADLRELRISRDGARVAALIGSGPKARLVVGQVVRDRNASPVRIQGVESIEHAGDPLRDPVSFDWYTPTSLVVLSNTAQGKQAPVIASIDGATVEPVATFQGGAIAQVAAGSDPSIPIVALAANGSVYALGAAERWERLAAPGTVTAMRYPG
jgi:hypothetical protein